MEDIYCKGINLTEHAARLCGFKKGANVMDVGCALGNDVKLLSDMGLNASGQDADSSLIDIARYKYPGLAFSVGENEQLNGLSLSKDGLFFIWTLSLTANQAEAVHEAYCLLRKGGKLVIADIYLRAPDLDRFEKERDEAIAVWDRPRQNRDCEVTATPPSPFCQDGVFLRPALDYMIEKSGFKLLHWEDHTPELSLLLQSGYREKSIIGESELTRRISSASVRRDTGYFFMIAEKT